MVDVLGSKGLRPRTIEPSAQTDDEPALDRRQTQRKKLTIDVSADLHRRILMICGTRRVPVNQAVREVLDRAFPGT